MARLVFLIAAALLLCGAGETPQTNAGNASTSTTWVNPSNALDDDADYAYNPTSGSGNTLDFDTFSFSIPQQARIRGVELLVRAARTCGPALGRAIQVCGLVSPDDGTTYSLARCVNTSANAATEYVIGGSADPFTLFSASPTLYVDWSPNPFNEDIFRFKLYTTWTSVACLGGVTMEIRVEYARVKIYYSMPDNDRIYEMERPAGVKVGGVEIE